MGRALAHIDCSSPSLQLQVRSRQFRSGAVHGRQTCHSACTATGSPPTDGKQTAMVCCGSVSALPVHTGCSFGPQILTVSNWQCWAAGCVRQSTSMRASRVPAPEA